MASSTPNPPSESYPFKPSIFCCHSSLNTLRQNRPFKPFTTACRYSIISTPSHFTLSSILKDAPPQHMIELTLTTQGNESPSRFFIYIWESDSSAWFEISEEEFWKYRKDLPCVTDKACVSCQEHEVGYGVLRYGMKEEVIEGMGLKKELSMGELLEVRRGVNRRKSSYGSGVAECSTE